MLVKGKINFKFVYIDCGRWNCTFNTPARRQLPPLLHCAVHTSRVYYYFKKLHLINMTPTT